MFVLCPFAIGEVTWAFRGLKILGLRFYS